MNEEQRFLRPVDIASALGVSVSRIYQLLSAGAIPATRVGGAIRIPRAAWDEWLKKTSEEALASLKGEG